MFKKYNVISSPISAQMRLLADAYVSSQKEFDVLPSKELKPALGFAEPFIWRKTNGDSGMAFILSEYYVFSEGGPDRFIRSKGICILDSFSVIGKHAATEEIKKEFHGDGLEFFIRRKRISIIPKEDYSNLGSEYITRKGRSHVVDELVFLSPEQINAGHADIIESEFTNSLRVIPSNASETFREQSLFNWSNSFNFDVAMVIPNEECSGCNICNLSTKNDNMEDKKYVDNAKTIRRSLIRVLGKPKFDSISMSFKV
jgi:hypothetical protein